MPGWCGPHRLLLRDVLGEVEHMFVTFTSRISSKYSCSRRTSSACTPPEGTGAGLKLCNVGGILGAVDATRTFTPIT
jgi:hypothetical protein